MLTFVRVDPGQLEQIVVLFCREPHCVDIDCVVNNRGPVDLLVSFLLGLADRHQSDLSVHLAKEFQFLWADRTVHRGDDRTSKSYGVSERDARIFGVFVHDIEAIAFDELVDTSQVGGLAHTLVWCAQVAQPVIAGHGDNIELGIRPDTSEDR
jgi:hypothetical protein